MLNQNAVDSSLIHKKESRYFVIALIFSVMVYLVLFVSIIGWFIIPVLFILPLVAQGIMLAHIRTNAVRMTPRQFPEVFATVHEQCARMGFYKVPDVYVMESSGILNAFASRFFGRNMVVLYSDLFELSQSGGSKELSFVIAHELAHIKRNHLTKQLLILPALWFPFIGEAYSRACEYTCDRMAAYYTDDAEAAMNGLTILAIGKKLYKQVDREEYLIQSSQEKGIFVWLAERLSTHPPLPKRIYAIQQSMGIHTPRLFPSSNAPVIVLASLAVLFVVALSIGILFSSSIAKFSETFSEAIEEEQVSESLSSTAADTDELLSAASNGEVEYVKSLLAAGADPNAMDEEGWTALMWAAQNNDIATASALIDAGAVLNFAEYSNEETALTVAIYSNSDEIVQLLLQSGADPSLQDSLGWTPLMTAANYGDIEAVELLLAAGADPNARDEYDMTAEDYAADNEYEEIVTRLKKEVNKQI